MAKHNVITRRKALVAGAGSVSAGLLLACGDPEVQVVTKEVAVEKVVVKEVPVEKIVQKTQIKEVPVEKIVTRNVVKTVEKVVDRIVVKKVEAEIPSRFNEAPSLAKLVASGDLPKVDDRLPKEPRVIEPFEKVGKYGGTLRYIDLEGGGHQTSSLRINGLLTFNQQGTEIRPDVAKSATLSEDGKTFTYELREGHKWSDGEPFTTEDIMFWWEDFMNDTDLNKRLSSTWRPGGEPAKFTAVSPTKLVIEFAVPHPGIMDLHGRAVMSGDGNFYLPKHWIKQFHKKYNPKADELAKKEGHDDWTQLFKTKRNPPGGFLVGRPRLFAWVTTKKTLNQIQLERNPYFHWVDTDGNQLPYVDVVDSVLVQDQEVYNLRLISGDVDFAMGYASLKDMPALKAGEDAGGYKIRLPKSNRPALLALFPNQTHADPVVRKLMANLDVRIALSIAIDRKAMNEAIFFGLGEPFAFTVLPSMPYYKEEWGKAHTEFDPVRANKLLDDAGLTERDSEGYRLQPDGNRFTLVMEIANLETPKEAMCEMVAENWKDIGVEGIVKVEAFGPFQEHKADGTMDIGTWHADRGGLFGRLSPLWFAYNSTWNMWGRRWVEWFTSDGENGEEPPQYIKDHKALFDEFLKTQTGTPENIKLGREYYQFFTDQLPVIGTIGWAPRPMLVHNQLINVPKTNIWWSSDTSFYPPYRAGQWSLDR